MTPKLRSTSEIPIVSQIWSESARSCLLLKRIARGAAVVPDVNLRSDGRLFFQLVVAAEVPVRLGLRIGRISVELPPETAAAITLQILNALSRCCSLIACSSGRTTTPRRKHAIKMDGQSS